jgi:lipoate-protein ligase A
MPPHIRLLPFAAADGATNMAADEAMLEAAADRELASLRFYTWSEPTLSLGYFQSAAGRELPNLSALPWVRRSTGGAAIVHHHELTYSFALPARAEWKSTESWICRLHKLLQVVLLDCGIASRVVVCGEQRKFGEVLCFLHHTPGDLVIEGSKIAGSAQRKMRGALLQHGSLLLRHSEFAPQLSGMNDLAQRELFTPEELAKWLVAKFAQETGAVIQATEWTDNELARVPQIRAEKYADREWNEKR